MLKGDPPLLAATDDGERCDFSPWVTMCTTAASLAAPS